MKKILNLIVYKNEAEKNSFLIKKIVENSQKKSTETVIIVKNNKTEIKSFILDALGGQFFEKVKILNFSEFEQKLLKKPEISKLKKIVNAYSIVKKTFADDFLYKEDIVNFLIDEKTEILFKDYFANRKKEGTKLDKKMIMLNKIFLEYKKLLDKKYKKIVLNTFETKVNYIVCLDFFEILDNNNAENLKKIYEKIEEINIFVSFNLKNNSNPELSSLNSFVLKKIKNVNINLLNITKNSSKTGNNLEIINKNLLGFDETTSENKINDIKLTKCKNIKLECEFIAKKIKKMLIENGNKFKNMLVVIDEIEKYKNIITKSFEKYEIPYYLTFKKTLLDENLAKIIICLFDIILSDFDFKMIIKCLETGFFSKKQIELHKIKNYLTKEGMLKSKKIKTDKTLKQAGMYNDLIISLQEFKRTSAEITGDKITKNFFELLEKLKIRTILQEKCEKLTKTGNIKSAEIQTEIWDSLIEILEVMYYELENIDINLKEYKEILVILFKNKIECSKKMNINEVVICSTDDIVKLSPEIVFIVGATRSNCLKKLGNSTIFNINEMKELCNITTCCESFDEIFIKKHLKLLKTYTIATKKMYISWPSTDSSGKKGVPAEIVEKIQKVFPNIKIENEDKQEIWTKRDVLKNFAHEHKNNSLISCDLKNMLKNDDFFSKKVEIIENMHKNEDLNLKNKYMFFLNKEIILTPSQIENYFTCPFKYFCKYVLKLKNNENNQFNSLEYGNLVHYVLEKFFVNNCQNNVVDLEKIDVNNEIKKIIDEFKIKNNSFYVNNSRISYLYHRCATTLEFFIRHISKEINQNVFKPEYFELKISSDGIVNPLVIKYNDCLIKVEGKIDRIDTMNHLGRNFFRIIDYKTGAKKFNLSYNLFGLDMQMIIYSNIVYNNQKNMFPAGILYITVKRPLVNFDKNEEKTNMELAKKTAMQGLILNEESVLAGISSTENSFFSLPNKAKTKKAEYLMNFNDFKTVFKHSENKIKIMVDNLVAGKIAPMPIMQENHTSCEWCQYKSVCKYDKNKFVFVKKISDNNKILSQMEII